MRIAALFCLAGILAAQNKPDALLQAMKDELERSRTLQFSGLDKPYYIEYTVEDQTGFSVSATLGGILTRNSSHVRIPRTRVRVGDYVFDNSNYMYSDLGAGRGSELPLDDNYSVLRRSFWLATDQAYKGAVEAIARKRAALKNITQAETLPDFWKAKPAEKIDPIPKFDASLDAWAERARDLSKVFSAYPEVLSSVVSVEGANAMFYFTNSEGTMVRTPEGLTTVNIRASGQSSDGMTVRDAISLPVVDPKNLPDATELRSLTDQVGQRIKALAGAPVGETYSGPVLFEGVAGAQLIAEVLAPQFALPRRPIAEPGRPAPVPVSEFEGRTGSRVLPEFLDVVDDASQKMWNGSALVGQYDLDYEGVAPAPLTLVEKGKLKTFLLTRQPVKGFEASNGHARVPGPFGANAAAISNLFVRASETVKRSELRAQFLKMVQDRGKPYGIVIRKMDFPTTAPGDELRRMFLGASQAGGGRPVSTPLLVYRVYPDGKEELVRGLRLRGLSVRTLRDIVAVSDESYVFNYLNTLAPMSMPGTGYVAPTSVVAPALLLEDVELERPQEELPKLPVVPPPALTITR
jgi:predicted Zn-dependent protease